MTLARRLHFVFKVDCEPLQDRSPACGGPESWAVSERVVRGIRDVFEARGLRRALIFNLTPEAAAAHAPIWRAWRHEGVQFGIQPNVPGFRFPMYAKDLGQYEESAQREIITGASEDFEAALGFRADTYSACCGSKSPVTLRLLYEAGYRQTFSPVPGRHFPDRPDRCTVGVFPYPHWGNARHHLLPGALPLCVVPHTGDTASGDGARPADLRAEAPVGEATRALFRRIIDHHVELSGLIQAPVRTIVGNTHNTGRVNLENVALVADYAREAATRAGLEFASVTMREIRAALMEAMPLSDIAAA
ncbi:MAG: hypothetical protein ACRDJN_11950 [Chloroflexota bacterium]